MLSPDEPQWSELIFDEDKPRVNYYVFCTPFIVGCQRKSRDLVSKIDAWSRLELRRPRCPMWDGEVVMWGNRLKHKYFSHAISNQTP